MEQLPRWTRDGPLSLATSPYFSAAAGTAPTDVLLASDEPASRKGEAEHSAETHADGDAPTGTTLGGLPDVERALLSLRLVAGLSCDAIARRTGLAESEVREIQLRGLRRLRILRDSG